MNIVIATYHDWDALYIDGINMMEDHTLLACDIVVALENKLPCVIDSFEIKSVDENWWHKEDKDSYPDKIEDVVFERE